MQRKEGIVVEQASDFEALDYLESERSEVEFFKDLETLLLEYLQKPSKYSAKLNVLGRLTDWQGLSLVEMGEKAEEKYKGSIRFERIKAETDGLRGLEHLYAKANPNDIIVLAMPPGKREEGFGNVSMTNISLVSDVEMGEKVITTYTIPSRNLSIQRHQEILSIASKDLEVEVTNENSSTRPDLIMASRPMRIIAGLKEGALERLLNELGHESFAKFESEVETALEKKEDKNALGRRKGLLAYLAMQIVSFRNKRNRNGLMALGRTVRSVFALESTGSFKDLDEMQMIGKFKDYMHGFMYKQELDRSYSSTMTMDIFANDPRIKQLWELHQLINNNPEAREKLEASSCGGGGWRDMFSNKFGGDFANLKQPSLIRELFNQSESNKEEYSFDHDGICVVCKSGPRALGPCEICEECDKKIRAQVE